MRILTVHFLWPSSSSLGFYCIYMNLYMYITLYIYTYKIYIHIIIYIQVYIHTHIHIKRRRQWHPTPVLSPGKSHGWRSLVGYSPWGRYKSDTTKRLHFHALEKEMATLSSVLAWRIPGTGKPSGLPSMGSHRVGHD